MRTTATFFQSSKIGSVLLLVYLHVLTVSAQSPAADELRRLQGAWTVTAGEQMGQPFDAIIGGKLTIKDRSFVLHTAGGNDFMGEIRINTAPSPPQVDFVHADGTAWEAIYSMNNDTFRICYVEKGVREGRPKTFTTSLESSALIVVLRRGE